MVLDEVAVDLIVPADLAAGVAVDLADAVVAVVVPRSAVSLSVILVAAVDVFLAAAVDVALAAADDVVLVAAATDVVLAAAVDVVLAATVDVVVVDLAEEGLLLLLLEVVADLAVVAVVVVGFAADLDESGFAVVDLTVSVVRLDTYAGQTFFQS